MKKGKFSMVRTQKIVLLLAICCSIFFVLVHGAEAFSLYDVYKYIPGPSGIPAFNESVIEAGGGVGEYLLLGSINIVLSAVYLLVGVLLIAVGLIFDWAVNPNNFYAVMQMEAIYKAWVIVRDFLNLAFILVLLFSAFATIFQVEKFHLKKILLTLVIMALLVNFSFPVARFIIDTANVTMYFILGKAFPELSNDTGLGAVILSFTKIDTLINPAKQGNGNEIGEVFTSAVADQKMVTFYLLSSIIYMFVLAITIGVIGILLVIRIVVLALLVIFSPVGFVASILPSTKNFANSWWDALFKQAFFGPVMAFMLYLAIIMMNEIEAEDIASFQGKVANNNFSVVITSFAKLAIPIIILWTGLIAAQKLGAAGSSVVIGKAGGIAKWPARMLGKALKFGVKAGLKKFDRDVLVKPEISKKLARKVGLDNLSPRTFVEAWKQKAAEVEEQVMGPAKGATRDKLNWMFNKTRTDYEQLEKDRIETKRRKEISEISENSSVLLNDLVPLVGVDSDTARTDIKSRAKILYKNRDVDEFMKFIRENYDKPILAGGKSFKDIKIKEKELGASTWNANQAVIRMLEASGEDKKQIGKTIIDLGEIGAGVSGIGFGGASFDKEGKIKLADTKWEQAELAIMKLETIDEIQNVAKKIHRNYIVDEDGGINAEFTVMAERGILAPLKDHINRHNPSFYKQVGDPKMIDKLKKHVEILQMDDSNPVKIKEGLVGRELNAEKAKIANEWIDTLDHYAKTGVKKMPEKEEKVSPIVDQYGKPIKKEKKKKVGVGEEELEEESYYE